MKLRDLVAVRCLRSNALRFGTDSFHTSAAFDLVVPKPGKTWRPVCCWCVESLDLDPDTIVDIRSRIYPLDRNDWCCLCDYRGCDVLIVPLDRQVLTLTRSERAGYVTQCHYEQFGRSPHHL